ncbi:MAG: serine/threonine protein kinase [Desulfobulbaceae bacterium]|nr:serine/threonine protein kinase [Desulfobulbaceae bacterium]HIJ78288.1 serine/threonine protein kinase [Deltaproteobacteria bacterium]
MKKQSEQNMRTGFGNLPPDLVLNLVENALATRCTNICRPLNSYINRVYELEQADGLGLVAKFYRPGRWSHEALQDEHDFLMDLATHEIPVVAPLRQINGETLGCHQGMFFAVFPKKGGRSFDEYSDEQWLQLGRLLGRAHGIGAQRTPRDRLSMAPDRSTRAQIDYILHGDFMDPDPARQFESITRELLTVITPLFDNIEMIRIHGDCHFSNLIYRPDESFYLIDLDDMAVGPPVQDFWMLLPGYLNDSLAEIDMFLEGYETFRDFDHRSLRLIEPLRAMRYIHYTAWCAHQFAEDGLSRVAPDFGSRDYWQREIRDLTEQLERIKELPEPMGNFC